MANKNEDLAIFTLKTSQNIHCLFEKAINNLKGVN